MDRGKHYGLFLMKSIHLSNVLAHTLYTGQDHVAQDYITKVPEATVYMNQPKRHVNATLLEGKYGSRTLYINFLPKITSFKTKNA